ncbi:MAG: HNH endonuclease [Clostridia bacterium]|nr:HNH endonuclease [Clostridia bacterium]
MRDKNRFKNKTNVYDLSGAYGIGYTSKGEKFYFDIDDYNKIKDYCWYMDTNGYIVTNSTNKDYHLLHRLILDAPNDFDVDHINHDKSDNRKQNLRLATTQQNCSNRIVTNKNGINGVYLSKGKWSVNIGYKNKLIQIGTFKTLEEAISARKMAEEKYYGEFSYANSKTKGGH